ncbi:MAG: AAA family ATPase [Hyphomicrobiaceae bacterium]
MRTWSVVSQKGGSGKTTLLLHLSVAAMAKGCAVSVIDLDPQRSAEQWSELRETLAGTDEPPVVHGSPTGLDGMLEAARETDTDLVLIDTPPAVDKSMIYAAAAADVVIVPTRSSVLDQFALAETLDYLKRIGALGKTVIIINAPGSDKRARAETERIASDGFGVSVLPLALDDQIDFSSSLNEGRGVTEAAPRRKSARTVHAIYDRLCEFERKLGRSRRKVSA